MTHLAQNICFWEYVGLENPKDSIRAIYEETTVEDINSVALTIFNDNNRVELVYLPKNN
jgi:predicted Zn-dependent peptidase